MLSLLYKNFLNTELLSECSEVSESILVRQDFAQRAPAPGEGEAFAVVLTDGQQEPEVMFCTSNPGAGELEVLRGQEDSVAKSWPAGTRVVMALTAAVLRQLPDEQVQQTLLAAQEFSSTAQTAATTATTKAGEAATSETGARLAAAATGPYVPFATDVDAQDALDNGTVIPGLGRALQTDDLVRAHVDTSRGGVTTQYRVDGTSLVEPFEPFSAALSRYANGLTLQQAFPTLPVASLYDLAGFNIVGLRAHVASVATDIDVLGPGIWESRIVDRSTACFGRIFDPNALGGWDGTIANLGSTVYGASGQGSGSGTGICWVRIDETDANVRHFGAVGNGVINDQPAIKAAALYAKSAAVGLYFPTPPVEYLMNTAGKQVRLNNLVNDLRIYGDGQATRIKRGDLTCIADFHVLFEITAAADANIDIVIENLYVDDNAAGNPLPDGAGGFAFEHSHAFSVLPSGANSIASLTYRNIGGRDGIADVCNASGSSVHRISQIVYENIEIPFRTRKRSDCTVTCDYDYLRAKNINVHAFEVETNSASTESLGDTTLENVTCNILDMLYKDERNRLSGRNVVVNDIMTLDGYNGFVEGTFNLKQPCRFVGFGSNGECRVKVMGTVNIAATLGSLFFIETPATSPTAVTIEADFTGCANASNLFYSNNAAFDGSSVVFRNCTTDGDTSSGIDIRVRGGDYTLDNYVSGGTTGVVLDQFADVTAVPTNRITMRGVELKAGKKAYRPAIAGNRVIINMTGNKSADGIGGLIDFTRYDKIASPRGSGVLLDFEQVDSSEGDAAPTTGKCVTGHLIRYRAPVAGGYSGARCVASGSPGAWKEYGLIES